MLCAVALESHQFRPGRVIPHRTWPNLTLQAPILASGIDRMQVVGYRWSASVFPLHLGAHRSMPGKGWSTPRTSFPPLPASECYHRYVARLLLRDC